MKTTPLTHAQTGMTIFSDHLGLMAVVLRTTEDGFRFRVLNGLWDGAVEDGKVRVADSTFTGSEEAGRLGESDFEQVLSVTRDEYDRWYMENHPQTASLINRPVTADPVRVSTDLEDVCEPVYETTLLVRVLGQGDGPDAFESWVAGLSLEDLGREMDQGELIGASRVIGTSKVPPGEVRTRLEEVGNDGSFFEDTPDSETGVPTHMRITEIRNEQGWNDGSMEHLAAAFIREAGLERAFLAHLEAQAAMENGCSDEPESL